MKIMSEFFDIDKRIEELADQAESECSQGFKEIERIAQKNGQKVLSAFIDNKVSEVCLKGTTGYGYDDMGREAIDKVYAQVLGGEDALVRHTFAKRFSVFFARAIRFWPARASPMIHLKR